MYYNRKLTDSFSGLIEAEGALRWLFDFVKNNPDLDFQIGRNNAREWISVYRGTSSIIKIFKRKDPQRITIAGAPIYKKMTPTLYGSKCISDNFQKDLEDIIEMIKINPAFNQYYKNKKEGYYQNIFSRKYGICGLLSDDFVIIDKESVVGYSDIPEQRKVMVPNQNKYKQLQEEISVLNPKLYGKNRENKETGDELDFLGLDKDGNVLLIEFKHGAYTSGIYLSPLQIGMYYDIFTGLSKQDLSKAVFEMLAQKQKIGLINPNWVKPPVIKEIIPVLVISEYNNKGTAKDRFNEIMKIIRTKLGIGFLQDLQIFTFTVNEGLSNW